MQLHRRGPGQQVLAANVDRVWVVHALDRALNLRSIEGAGKSTLVNLLAEEALTGTGTVREGDAKGRHTTTRRELFLIRGGALLLDTPDLRELRVWDLDEGLGAAFADIEQLAEQCRFRDCRHESEPGCAVLAAVEDGTLSGERLASHQKLRAEAAYQHRRVDPQAKAAEVAKYKTALKTLKYHPKHGGKS